MRTLLVYASKNGATTECARYIRKGLKEEVTVIDLTKEQPTNLSAYDTIVAGTSVYAGSLRTEFKKFMENNNEKLPNKKVFLFLSCLDAKKMEDYIRPVLSEEERKNIKAVVSCGGILDMTKLNFIERALMKQIMKKEKDENGNPLVLKKDTVLDQLDYHAMDELIAKINEA